jgi:hypothetical protein
MCTRIPAKGAVVRVHQGVTTKDGRDISGLLLTVVDVHAVVEIDGTEWTGDRPIHLIASQVDIVTPEGL